MIFHFHPFMWYFCKPKRRYYDDGWSIPFLCFTVEWTGVS